MKRFAAVSGATLLAVVAVLLASLAFAGTASAAVTSKVIAPSGAPFTTATPHWVSEDGRYVVYDDEGLYLADTVNGTSSFIAGAPEANPSVSDDGRYVAYTDAADETTRAYVWDRTTGTSALVSVTSDEEPMSASPLGVTISGDGRYVAFLSQDSESLPAGWGLGDGVFLRDRTGGTTELISATPTHRAWFGEGSGVAPSLSDDGSVAAWPGALLSGPPFFPDPGAGGFGGTDGIIVWERATGLRVLEERVDRANGENNWGVMLSGDGDSAVWAGCDPSPACDSPDFRYGVFVSDLDTEEHEFIANGWGAAISDDGRYVSYAYGETDNDHDVFRYDRETNAPTQVNFNPNGSRAPANALTGISGDGSKVAFSAGAEPRLLLAAVGGVIRPKLDPQAPPKDAAWAWGRNAEGQLGTGGTTGRLLPGEVQGLSDTKAFAAGDRHSLALKSDGTVWSWGWNAFGQLGDGTTSQRNTPVRVSGLTGVKTIAAGIWHSVALKFDGTVWAWGTGGSGQLGNGSFSQRNSPVQVSGLSGVAGLAAGRLHSLALKSDGTVSAWGANYDGQLGDGTTLGRTSPVQVSGLTGVAALAAGGSHSLALKSDGTVSAWGANYGGQLGDGTNSVGRTSPVRVSGLTGGAAIAAGGSHSLALKSDGTVSAWGANSDGQLGDGTALGRTSPVQVSGLSGVAGLAAGDRHSLAVGRTSPTLGVESFTTTLGAGETVTTDVEDDGATAADPIETTLTTPTAGVVSVAETPSSGSTGEFSIAGRRVDITAPDATPANPLVIRFRLDQTLFQVSWPLSSLSVVRNGSVVAACNGPGASPDPCVESRTRLPDGDVEVVARTSRASEWLIGRAGPAADAGGPYSVAEGSTVRLEGNASGGEAPLDLRWLGAASELDDETATLPRFTGLDDGLLTLSLFVTDAAGLSGIDDTTVTVTNRRPLVSPIAVAKNNGTKLELKTGFTDPGRLDTHTARVRWGDSTESVGRVAENGGAGTVTADHTYARQGTYTVRLTVRDDDGGEQAVERRINVGTLSVAPGPSCAGRPATIVVTGSALVKGTSGRDVIVGTSGRNRIDGRGGGDRICGAGGRDKIKGGGGNDRIYSQGGDDTASGGSGKDRLSGGSGKDGLSGNSGRDTLLGGPSGDKLFGGSGKDRLSGGSGRDLLAGGSAEDRVSCGSGYDRVRGGGPDRVRRCERP